MLSSSMSDSTREDNSDVSKMTCHYAISKNGIRHTHIDYLSSVPKRRRNSFLIMYHRYRCVPCQNTSWGVIQYGRPCIRWNKLAILSIMPRFHYEWTIMSILGRLILDLRFGLFSSFAYYRVDSLFTIMFVWLCRIDTWDTISLFLSPLHIAWFLLVSLLF